MAVEGGLTAVVGSCSASIGVTGVACGATVGVGSSSLRQAENSRGNIRRNNIILAKRLVDIYFYNSILFEKFYLRLHYNQR
jgi:hypothetical protein